MKKFSIVSLFIILSLVSCQKKIKPANPALASIDLLRGDLALCGGTDFGDVEFALSCTYATQETFNLAVSLLHSFEYEEAEKAFVKVIDEDPNCPMAYWGVAMSIYHTIWFEPTPEVLEKGSNILEIAQTLPQTERERDYLNAIGAFYNDWQTIDHKTREERMERKMEENYLKYKDDTEAAIFYALALKSTADPNDPNHVKEKKAGKILESIFPDQPNHPGIAHYIIHNYDNTELAHLALTPARRYAEIAPSSAHALHMPSHIFTRLGLWDESIKSNEYSASAAQCYAQEVEMDGVWANELHAMDYLVYAYLQKGDNISAIKQNDYMSTIYDINPHNIRAIAYPFAAIPVRIALENKLWENASQLELHNSEIEWKDFPWEIAIFHYGRALGAAHIKDYDLAEREIMILKSLQLELANNEQKYYSNQVMIQIKTAEAWLEFYEGDQVMALALMKEAAEMEDATQKHGVTPGEVLPARELYADMLMEMDKFNEALVAYELNLKGRPGRFNSLYGAAIASKETGNKEKAIQYFEMIAELTDGVKTDRTEVLDAKMYLENKPT